MTFIKKLILIFFINTVFCFSQTWVTSVSPHINQQSVERNSPISVTFDRELNISTSIESTVVVIGNNFGKYKPLSITYNQRTNTITFIPIKQFRSGEKVQVSVTQKIKDTNGNPMPKGFVWEFLIGANAKYGQLSSFFDVKNGIAISGDLTPLDYDNDGILDVAIAEENYVGRINFFKGNGNGTFQPAYSVNVGTVENSVISADFDNDGDIDVITERDSLLMLINDGTGKFPTSKNFGLKTLLRNIYTADFNADGNMDLLMMNDRDSNCAIFLNDGKANFPTRIYTPNVHSGTNRGTIGDFNNDGALDFIVTHTYGGYPTAIGWVSMYLNDGFGNMTLNYQQEFPNETLVPIAGDLDNDGDLDFVFNQSFRYNQGKDSLGIWTLINDGTGKFSVKDLYRSQKEFMGTIAMNDFDGDGDIDFASCDGRTVPSKLAIFWNDGNANFTRTQVATKYSADLLFPADIDDDGDVDILSSSYCYCGPFLEVFINDTPASVEKLFSSQPLSNEVIQNYPNPFNSTTTIRYIVTNPSKVKMEVFDMLGRKIETLIDEIQNGKAYNIRWNTNIASGLYLCRLETQSNDNPSKVFVSTRKMQLIK